MVLNVPLSTGRLQDLAFWLNNHASPAMGMVFILVSGALSLAGLFRRGGYLANGLLWLTVINLHAALYASLTAGDYLLNQLLFFNIFFSGSPPASAFSRDLANAFHNVALAGVRIQVCLAYFLAAWFKLTDASWLDGSALQAIFQVPEYSSAFLAALPPWLCLASTYATLTYQLLFPFTIWLRPFKIYLLAFGVAQHLLIAFGMGLFSFSIIMLISYLLFLEYDSGKDGN